MSIRIILATLLIPTALIVHGQTDSLAAPRDTSNFNTIIDSLDTGLTIIVPDTVVIEEGPIDEIITYPAKDSTVYDIAEQRVRMYNAAKVTYGSITLEADFIEYDFIHGTVLAYGRTDSLGAPIGRPIFTESGQVFTADTIRYNFESKKGVIKKVRTNDGESYVHAEVSKKQKNDHIHNLGGKYTTCDKEKPHYHFRFNKMVVIPDDKVITGPVYMKIGNVPTPLALPFGFFPNTTEQKQGILIPSYGYSSGLGYFLIDGGYYIPVNDHWDTKITGDIYSRGSWGGRNLTRYFKKYRYSGNTDFSFTNVLNGDRELNGFSKTQSFFFRWSHRQDSKARPSTSFSANVNMGTSNNFTNNLNSSQNDYISNTFGSGVNFSKRFSSSQFTASLSHSQNTSSRSFTLTLPQLSYSKDRFFIPLSWATNDAVKAKKLDSKLGITYSSNFKNTLRTTEPQLRFDNLDVLSGQLVNGIEHRVTAGSSVKLGHFTLNPNASFNERWHFAKRRDQYDSGSEAVLSDTLNGFYTTRDYSFGTNLTTKIYGMSTFKGEGVQAIRLVMTPSLGYTLTPERSFSDSYQDSTSTAIEYDPFLVSAYTQRNVSKRSAINFALQNSLEMKVKTGRDSVATTKKVKLIENFSASTSYNLAADEFQLSNLALSARTTLFKNTRISYSGVFDPYAVDQEGQRINVYRFNSGGPILRNTSNNFSLSTSLTGGKGVKRDPVDVDFNDDRELEEIENNKEDYIDFKIPWSLNLVYSVRTTKSFMFIEERGLIDTTRIQQGITFDGDFRVLEKWKVGFSSGYDFVEGEWTPTNLSLSWDLHCWELQGNVIPFGDRKSYNVRIGVKASVLRDLKLQKRGNLDSGRNLPY